MGWLGIDWQAVEAIGTWLAAVVVLLAASYAWRSELPEAKRARNAQVAVALFNELRSEDMKEKLRRIYNLQTEDVPSKMEQEVSYVIDRMDMLGALVAKGIIDEKVALALMRGAPLRCWYKLRSYISKVREERGYYASFMEYYAHRCLKYQWEEVPQKEWTKLYGQDLITLLKDDLLPEREKPYR